MEGVWESSRRVEDFEVRGFEDDDVVPFLVFFWVLFGFVAVVDGPAEGDARGRGGLNGRRLRFCGGARSVGILFAFCMDVSIVLPA